MKHMKLFENFLNEELRPDEMEEFAKKIADSMPNHTIYDDEEGPSDIQIKAAFKYFPDFKQYSTSKQKEEIIQMIKDNL